MTSRRNEHFELIIFENVMPKLSQFFHINLQKQTILYSIRFLNLNKFCFLTKYYSFMQNLQNLNHSIQKIIEFLVQQDPAKAFLLKRNIFSNLLISKQIFSSHLIKLI